MQYFGKKLRQLRQNRNMTQADLAEKLEISRATIGAYETGRMFPSLSIFQEIVAIFNVSAEYLLNFDKREWVSISGLSHNDIKKIKDIITDMKNINKYDLGDE